MAVKIHMLRMKGKSPISCWVFILEKRGKSEPKADWMLFPPELQELGMSLLHHKHAFLGFYRDNVTQIFLKSHFTGWNINSQDFSRVLGNKTRYVSSEEASK